MITTKNLTISSLLIIAFGLSVWSILLSLHSNVSISRKNTSAPDAFAENVIAIVIDKKGSPSLKISAPLMTHYPSSDTTEIKNPQVILFRDFSNPWHINSLFATAIKGVSEITFSKNVIIQHAADRDNPNTKIQTDSLTIFPEKKIASTDKAIVVTQPETIVHAIGMIANMDDGTIKLLSQAKGEYAPLSNS